MAEAFSAQVSDRICKHMNDDHADAVAFYAQVYGNVPEAEAAQMLSIDADGMNLTAQVNGTAQPVRILFEKPLQDAKEAHVVLVEMLKKKS